MMINVIEIICNTLLVSLPEEVFVVVILYMFSNSQLVHNLVQMRFKINKGLVLIPAIIPALISNVVRVLGYQSSILSMLSPLVLLILTIYISITDRQNKAIRKSLKGLVVGFFGITVTNLSMMLVVKVLGGDIRNLSMISKILYSLPINLSYFIILCIILPLYSRDITLKDLLNKRNQNIMFIFTAVTTIFMIIGFKLIIYDNIFRGHEELSILSLILIPMILLIFMIYKIYKISYNIRLKKFDELYKQ